jgi:hypothetical protein
VNINIKTSTGSSRAAEPLRAPLVRRRGRRLLIAVGVGAGFAALAAALVLLTTGHGIKPRASAPTTAARSLPDAPKPLYAKTGVRVFGWPPVRRASYYDVRLFRAGVKIFEARTAVTRLALPPRWTLDGRRLSLRPGNYVWQVRPGFGPVGAARYGAPIVHAKLVVRN